MTPKERALKENPNLPLKGKGSRPWQAPKNPFFGRPEAIEHNRRGGRKGGSKSKRTGVPHGMTREKVEEVRASVAPASKELVNKMTAKYAGTESEYAKEALEYAVSVVKAGIDGTRDRLQAARLILDFCKEKPASKSNVTISKAEDLLAVLEAEESDGPGAA